MVKFENFWRGTFVSLTSKVCPKFHVRRCYSINHVRFRVKMLKLKIYIVILGQAAVTRSFCLEQGSFLYILCKNRKLEWNRKVYLKWKQMQIQMQPQKWRWGGKGDYIPFVSHLPLRFHCSSSFTRFSLPFENPLPLYLKYKILYLFYATKIPIHEAFLNVRRHEKIFALSRAAHVPNVENYQKIKVISVST